MALTQKEKEMVKELYNKGKAYEKEIARLKLFIEKATNMNLAYNKKINQERGKIKTLDTQLKNKVKELKYDLDVIDSAIKDCYTRLNYTENHSYNSVTEKNKAIKNWKDKVKKHEQSKKDINKKINEYTKQINSKISQIDKEEKKLCQEQKKLLREIQKAKKIIIDSNKQIKIIQQKLLVLNKKANK